jgi:hypothetical protein
MGVVEDIGLWRARRAQQVASHDVAMGAPPFVLEEPCPGCGAERIGEMVWRSQPGKRPLPLPRIAPHFLCREGRVVYQDVTDSPEPVTSWKQILGRFQLSADR